MSATNWIRIAALLGGLSVIAGSFGAHGLKGHVEPKDLETFETAARYQMYHALALLGIGLLALHQGSSPPIQIAGWCFLGGTLIFSGTLYALVLTGIRWLGAITPIGGVLMIVGWGILAFVAAPAKVLE